MSSPSEAGGWLSAARSEEANTNRLPAAGFRNASLVKGVDAPLSDGAFGFLPFRGRWPGAERRVGGGLSGEPGAASLVRQRYGWFSSWGPWASDPLRLLALRLASTSPLGVITGDVVPGGMG